MLHLKKVPVTGVITVRRREAGIVGTGCGGGQQGGVMRFPVHLPPFASGVLPNGVTPNARGGGGVVQRAGQRN